MPLPENTQALVRRIERLDRDERIVYEHLETLEHPHNADEIVDQLKFAGYDDFHVGATIGYLNQITRLGLAKRLRPKGLPKSYWSLKHYGLPYKKRSVPMPSPGFLPPVEGLVFHEDIHRYRYQSNWVPWSVTRITGHDMSPSKRSNILKTKAQWEPRGNAVHNAMEAFLTGKQDVTTVDGYDTFHAWITPLLFHPIWERYQPIACEHRMVSPDASVAGSLDVLLSNGSEIVLCDLKTQSNARAAPYDTSRQLGAYCWLLDHCHGIQPVKCITLWARPGHTAQTIADPSDCLSSWNDCYAKFLLTQPNF